MTQDAESQPQGAHQSGFTLAEIAREIGASVEGDGDYRVGRPVPAGLPAGPEDLVVALGRDPREQLAKAGARVAVIAQGAERPDGLAGLLIAERPRLVFGRLLTLFAPPLHAPPGVHPLAMVDPTAELGEGVSVGPFVVVGPGARIGARCRLLSQVTIGRGASLGDDCLLHAGVRIGERVRIGHRVILQPNAVIGADGFSYVSPTRSSAEQRGGTKSTVDNPNEPVERIPSLGTVEIGDDVEIGANAAVDRATLEATRIGARTKIDNLVQVAHNCRIGEDCLIAGQVGLSGSTRVGDRVVIGGQSGIADHLTLGDDCVIGGGSAVGRDVPAGEIQVGHPARRKEDKLAELFNINRLPRMLRDLLDLRKRVASLEKIAAGGRGEGRGEV